MNGINGMNFFGWIRDSVRQSVLLGVSDAVEQLGSPSPKEELHPSIAGFLKVEASGIEAPKQLQAGAGARGSKSRKRLGKSLKDIGADSPKANRE